MHITLLYVMRRVCVPQGKAVNIIAEGILGHFASTGQKVTLLATGCLTNVATLIIVYPEIKDVLDRIGACGRVVLL